jgi:hypothetical protein
MIAAALALFFLVSLFAKIVEFERCKCAHENPSDF